MTYTPTTHRPDIVNEAPRITSADNVADIIRDMIGDKIKTKEHFCVVTLDGASRAIRSEIIHIGTLNQSIVHPREVFRPAILDNAAAVIISHNHPSGTLEASRADMKITNRLKDVAKLVGIELLDHVIVTADGHYSFSEDGLL